MTDMDSARDIRIGIAERWCKSVRDYAIREERARQEMERIRMSADGLKAQRYDMVGGRSAMEHGDDSMFAIIDRIDQAVERLIQATGDMLDEGEEFNRALDAMENQAYARILHLRYVMRWEWADIAREVPYTYHHLCGYAREAALEQLYDHMPERLMMPRAID